MKPQVPGKELSAMLGWLKLTPEARKFFFARRDEFAGPKRGNKFAVYAQAIEENAAWDAAFAEQAARAIVYAAERERRRIARQAAEAIRIEARRVLIAQRRSEGARRAAATRARNAETARRLAELENA